MEGWFEKHWFDAIQSAAIVCGLFFNFVTVRDAAKARRTSNLSKLIQQHRDLWRDYAANPALQRIKDIAVDLRASPITREEETFVRLVINHLFGAYQAAQSRELGDIERVDRDAATFLAFPIPLAVWNQVKDIQNVDFVSFIETAKLRWTRSE